MVMECSKRVIKRIKKGVFVVAPRVLDRKEPCTDKAVSSISYVVFGNYRSDSSLYAIIRLPLCALFATMLQAWRALILLKFRFNSLPALRSKDFDLHKTAETVRNFALHGLGLGAEAKDSPLEQRLSEGPIDLG